jgi:D-amino peptidase
MWLNGEKIGEIGMEFALAGYFGVPVVLVTGDEAACREAKTYVPEVEVAAVKQGITRGSAICLHPEKARALIREKTELALRRVKEIPPYRVQPPFELRTRYVPTSLAFTASQRPGVELVDARTTVARGDDFLDLVSKRF